jgi:hypothetical protein
MLRVNLLPPYIYDKQKKAKVAVLWGVGLAAVIVGMVVWAGGVQSTLNAENSHLDSAKQYQDQYTKADNDITAVNQAIATTKAKQDFIASAQAYNAAWPRVYEAMASATSPDILLKTMAVDGGNHKSLRLTGFCPTEMQLARWWMSLRNDVNMFDSVAISLPPHPYTPGAANGARPGGFGASGFGGRPGGMPGMPPGMMGGSMPGGMMGSSMPGGMGAAGKQGFMAAMGGGGGFGGGGGGAVGSASESMVEGKRGLDFVANLVLNDKLAPPAATPAWGAGGGGGGMGMGRMMMGGMPGGAMGGMPPMMSGGPGGPVGMSGGPGRGGKD